MIPGRFATRRLSVRNWCGDIADPHLRGSLEAELAVILTPAVLGPLPPSMQLEDRTDSIAAWVEARCAESTVLLVRQRQDDRLIGLMVLVDSPDAGDIPTIHVGYLFAETAWGFGYATELLNGFVAACRPAQAMCLIAGVDRSNPASAHVLQKSGFTLRAKLSYATTEMYSCDIQQTGRRND